MSSTYSVSSSFKTTISTNASSATIGSKASTIPAARADATSSVPVPAPAGSVPASRSDVFPARKPPSKRASS